MHDHNLFTLRETIWYSVIPGVASLDGVTQSRRMAMERTPLSTTLRWRGVSGGIREWTQLVGQ